jgi:ribose/xylose/arabinose/galactoside ABC-type transport system permease subunit
MIGGQEARHEVFARCRRRPEFRAVILFALLLIVLAFWQPAVFSSYGVVLQTAAVTMLVAAGLTVVLVQGELDLSVGSTLALAGVLVAKSSHSLLVGALVAIAVGVAVGVLNGLLVTRGGVNSFIATLGTMIALGGLALVIANDQQVPIKDWQAGISFGQKVLGALTPRILITLGAVVGVHLFLSRSRIGREFYAVGGNRAAALDAGIPTRRRIMAGFVLCSTAAALAGVIVTIELTTADPNAGNIVLLNSIAAAVIGGASLNGGRGTILGTTLGAVGLAALTVGLEFAGVGPNVLNMTVGIVLILAVAAGRLQLLIQALRHARIRFEHDRVGRESSAEFTS